MNTQHTDSYDIIVIGGGHAGIEAAYAAATMGSKTALVTLDINKIGLMPCNPSIGGVGKGHITFEISALGGLMPKLCTTTYLQARMLNTSKGAAVHGLRLQIDKHAYNKKSIESLKNTPNLTLIAGMVDHILLENDTVIRGVQLADGTVIHASAVIVTTGTFLNGLIHIGDVQKPAGRDGEGTVVALARWFYDRGLKMGRLKTGTPPRLKRDTIDFSKLEYQECEPLSYLYEFEHHTVTNSHACYIARTNEKTHQIIRDNINKSAMYCGIATGIGPRYCPSIEDKIMRFADKASHQIFVEPEGKDDESVYPSGISTSLPLEIQKAYIQSIEGFENAQIIKPGYAVEYDFIFPNQLHHTLELKNTKGLFLAGQINGTTGYEEAAGQGLIAGINAALQIKNEKPFILPRTESYIGVMIDDLVTLSVDEPYRMFTSRAERRLTLRQDNAFYRLSTYAYQLGMINECLYNAITTEEMNIKECIEKIKNGKPSAEIQKLIAAPKCDVAALRAALDITFTDRSIQTIHAELHYAPYLEREEREIKRTEQYKNLKIPASLIYTDLPGLSKELQQKLNKIKPETIAQAALIPGITPAALSLLIVTLRRKDNKKFANSNNNRANTAL